jgi:peroxiredoxin
MLNMGIDDVYCISVNDAFVMRQWGIVQGLVEDKNIDNPDPKCPLNPGNFTTIKLIPDGAAKFTKAMGMNCESPFASLDCCFITVLFVRVSEVCRSIGARLL